MGFSNKTEKTSGTSNQTMTGTTTPTNPSWVDSGLAGFGGTLGNLAGADPSSFVAPANPLQNLAGANATNLSGTPWAYDGATDLARSVGQADTPDIASLMSKFQNPYTKQVVDTSLADFDHNAGMTQAQQTLDMTRSHALGGSGSALTRSLTAGELARGRGTLDAGLRNTGFQTSLGGATSQAQLQQQQMAQRLQAAGAISGIAGDYGANQRANIATQGGIGSVLQGLDQAKTGAPLSTAALISSIWGGLPLGLEHGTNTTGTSTGTTTGTSSSSGAGLGDWLNYMANAAKAAMAGGG